MKSLNTGARQVFDLQVVVELGSLKVGKAGLPPLFYSPELDEFDLLRLFV
jgi:hypothetical protein